MVSRCKGRLHLSPRRAAESAVPLSWPAYVTADDLARRPEFRAPAGHPDSRPEARAVQLVSANAHPKREQLEKGGWTFKQSERGWLAVNRLLDRALTRPTIDMLIETIVSGDVVR
jgi:hypothetical protein